MVTLIMIVISPSSLIFFHSSIFKDVITLDLMNYYFLRIHCVRNDIINTWELLLKFKSLRISVIYILILLVVLMILLRYLSLSKIQSNKTQKAKYVLIFISRLPDIQRLILIQCCISLQYAHSHVFYLRKVRNIFPIIVSLVSRLCILEKKLWYKVMFGIKVSK